MKSKEKIIDMTTTEWEIDTLYSGQREREESMEEYGRVWESMGEYVKCWNLLTDWLTEQTVTSKSAVCTDKGLYFVLYW